MKKDMQTLSAKMMALTISFSLLSPLGSLAQHSESNTPSATAGVAGAEGVDCNLTAEEKNALKASFEKAKSDAEITRAAWAELETALGKAKTKRTISISVTTAGVLLAAVSGGLFYNTAKAANPILKDSGFLLFEALGVAVGAGVAGSGAIAWKITSGSVSNAIAKVKAKKAELDAQTARQDTILKQILNCK